VDNTVSKKVVEVSSQKLVHIQKPANQEQVPDGANSAKLHNERSEEQLPRKEKKEKYIKKNKMTERKDQNNSESEVASAISITTPQTPSSMAQVIQLMVIHSHSKDVQQRGCMAMLKFARDSSSIFRS
jgi:hypothetical protein